MRAKFMAACLSWVREGHVGERGLDGVAIAHAHEAENDDAVIGLQTLAHDAQAVEQRPERDGAIDGLVLGIEHPDVAAALVIADGGIADEQAVVFAAAGDAHFGKEAGRHEAVFVGKMPRARMVPVAGLIWLSTKSICPLWGKPCSLPSAISAAIGSINGILRTPLTMHLAVFRKTERSSASNVAVDRVERDDRWSAGSRWRCCRR
jgi:hypothetical protein